MSKLVAIILAIFTIAIVLGIGVYGRIISGDEGVMAAWSEVVNQYQRRVDLIPNLVSIVKYSAVNEKDILKGVVETRAKAAVIQVTSETLNDPAAFQKFSQVQDQLGSALSKLLNTVERYPEVKSTQPFKDLLNQLEGTENRITVARKRYIGAVRDYNLSVQKFPGSLFASRMGHEVKPNFSMSNKAEISTLPAVNFNNAPAKN